jgi:hypothetical protein
MIDNQLYGDYALKTVAGIPNTCWYNSGFPDGAFNFYPVPYAAFTAFVTCRRLLSGATVTLDSTVSLPPGYERMMVDNLGVDICSSFGQQVDQQLARSAVESKGIIKRTNNVSLEMDTGLGYYYPGPTDFIYKGF